MKKLFFLLCILLCLIVPSTCKKLEKSMLVSTGEVTSITTNSADASGQVVDLGGGATQHGHCYSTAANATIAGTKAELGVPAAGGFTSQLTNLTAGTKYYIKAYISNASETVYGKEISFSTISVSAPTLTTTAITSITATSASSGGNISSDGGASVTARGVCWSTTATPTTLNSKTTDGTGSGSFTSSITGLSSGTIYYVRAYAVNSAGTAYGNELSFTSGYLLPSLTTTAITSVASTSASSGGNITSDGGAAVTARGVCWNTSANPTVANNITTDGTGSGSFVSSIAGLSPGTTYYIRAYATNSTGTAYGNELTFSATAVLPTLTTTAIISITSTTASSGGNITNDGGASVTARGVCWSTATNPTISGSKTNNGTGTGSFVSSLTSLTPGSTYYVRAYATNSAGTVYGNELTFSASAVLPTLTTNAASAITATTATGGGNITNAGGASVTARGVCWSTSANPTTADYTTSNGTGSGSFVSSLTGLTSNTTYYIRAYATNSVGTAYGSQLSFTTTILLPALTTDAVSSITATTATCGGNISSEGGAPVTVRGVCWGTTTNPTTVNSNTVDGTGTGTFTSSLTGLIHGTTYYVRAYATNSGGTTYGNEVSFTAAIELPTLTSLAISSITSTNASSGGSITSNGGSPVTARGVCWSTTTGPTISDSKTDNGTDVGNFVSSLTGLTPGSTYYVRAYATNSAGTAYGNELSFAASPVLPTINTMDASSITATTASSGGNITSDGGASVTLRGVCWNTATSPTTTNSKTTDGTGTGTFASSLSGLTPGKTYYVRAYASNSAGTAYGNEISFTTSAVIPTLTTTAITLITSTAASSGGNISSDGGATISARGVCWSTSASPTIANNISSDGSGAGSFVSSLSGLTSNTTYYVRAYATNVAGTAYGDEISFTTYNWVLGTVNDYDGNTYNTIIIGPQVWMRENLKVTHYNNGDAIPEVIDGAAWSNLSTGAYCNYINDVANVATYGRLYNWYAATDTRSLCPTGWHIPTDSEWTTLITFLGGATVAGGKMKEAGLAHWISPNTGAINSSGFTALPGGRRSYTSGSFSAIGLSGYWWETDWQYQYMDNDNDNITKSSAVVSSVKKYGNSIRCVKD